MMDVVVVVVVVVVDVVGMMILAQLHPVSSLLVVD